MLARLKQALRRWNVGPALKLLLLFLAYPTLTRFILTGVIAVRSEEGNASLLTLHVLIRPLLIADYLVVAIGLLFVVGVPILSVRYRKRPRDLQLGFRRGMLLASVLLAVVVPLQGLILGLALCVAALDQLWFWGLFSAAGAVGATIALLQTGLRNEPGIYLTLRAARVRLEEHPRLQAEMTDVAQELGIPLPSHILVGLQPEMLETVATVFCSEGELHGGVLCLSLPESSILSIAEFRALLAEALVRLQASLNENRAQFLSGTEGANDMVKNLDQTIKDWSWWPRILPHPYFILFWWAIVAAMRFPLYLGREWLIFYLRSAWISRQILDVDVSMDSYRKSAQDVGAIPVLSALMKEAALTFLFILHPLKKPPVPHPLSPVVTRLTQEHPKMRFAPQRSHWKDLPSAWEYLQFRCRLAGKNPDWCLKLAEDVSPAEPAVWLFEDAAGLQARILALLEKPFVMASKAGTQS